MNNIRKNKWKISERNLPGSSVHEILQAGILEWVAIPFSRGSSQPRNSTWVSHIAHRFFTIWATREAQSKLYCNIFKKAYIERQNYMLQPSKVYFRESKMFCIWKISIKVLYHMNRLKKKKYMIISVETRNI